ncbi:CoA transferase [Parapusillimonas sp. SGNA-6]|nr:CoA transferase [Parapusillimonas sp. SGNA-6]
MAHSAEQPSTGVGPLNGLRVLDLTTVLMGPYASQLLGDMGADVIKVEPPGGDIVRQIGAARNPGMGGLFINTNRSKRSIVLDLKSDADRENLLLIASTCDVLLYNVRPQAMSRLKLAYEDIVAVRPDIIYVGVYGYGEQGAYAGKPAYDDLIQGASGLASLFCQGAGDSPRYVPLAIADRVVGIHAVNSVLAAAYHRSMTGQGQRIDVPMFETMVSMVFGDHLAGLTFEPGLDDGGYARLLAEHRRPYQTKDGYICALIYNDKHWKSFFAALGKSIESDPRLRNHSERTKHIREIYAELAELFLERTTEEWHELLTEADIPVMPLHTITSIFDDPHLKSVDFFQEVQHPTEGTVRSMRIPSTWSVTQPSITRFAPRLDENREEILSEARQLAQRPVQSCQTLEP